MFSLIEAYLPQFLSLSLVSLIGIMSPGADFAMVTRNSVFFSRKVALCTALGVSLGVLFHMSYIVLGLGCLILTNPEIAVGLQYAGAAYLFYIGVRSFMAKTGPVEQVQGRTESLSPIGALRMGLTTNILNVQCALFLLSLFAGVVGANIPFAFQVIFSLWRFLMNLSWFSLVAFIFTVPAVQTKFLAMGRWFNIAMGIILCLLSVNILMADITSQCPTP